MSIGHKELHRRILGIYNRLHFNQLDTQEALDECIDLLIAFVHHKEVTRMIHDMQDIIREDQAQEERPSRKYAMIP